MANAYKMSFTKFASFFAKEEDVTISDLEEMKKIVEEEIRKRKEKQ